MCYDTILSYRHACLKMNEQSFPEGYVLCVLIRSSLTGMLVPKNEWTIIP